MTKSGNMSAMRLKSEQNLKASKILSDVDIQCYASAIHCVYYSCFQLSKYVLAHFCGKSYECQEKESKGKDSHFYVVDNMSKALDGISHLAFIDYYAYYSKLKSLRRKADYSVQPILEPDVQKAQEQAEKLTNLLKDKYNII